MKFWAIGLVLLAAGASGARAADPMQAFPPAEAGMARYVVAKLGPMAGTLMVVDPNAPKVARFIALGGEPYLVRYSSRLPVVVYVPVNAEVRYRIWSAAPEAKPMEKG
ncbi:MAG: ecotin family protein [Burkholderiales bacterium]